MARTALALGLALAGLTALIVGGAFTAGSTPGSIAPGVPTAAFNLTLEILLVTGLTIGAFLARSGRIEAHRRNQTVWVLVNAALVIFMMLPSMQDVKITKLSELSDVRTAITWAHALAGTLTVTSGLWLVLQMNDVIPARFHVRWWKKLMRLTLAGYWATAFGGLATYYYWYHAS